MDPVTTSWNAQDSQQVALPEGLNDVMAKPTIASRTYEVLQPEAYTQLVMEARVNLRKQSQLGQTLTSREDNERIVGADLIVVE